MSEELLSLRTPPIGRYTGGLERGRVPVSSPGEGKRIMISNRRMWIRLSARSGVLCFLMLAVALVIPARAQVSSRPTTRPVYPATRPAYPTTRPVYPATRPGYSATRPSYPATQSPYASLPIGNPGPDPRQYPVGKSGPTTGPVWNGAEPKTAMEWAAYVSSMSRRRDDANIRRGVDALVKMGPAAIPALMVYLGDNPDTSPFPIAVALSRIDGSAVHVAKALEDHDPVRRNMAAHALHLMGPKAAPAVRELAAAVEKTPNARHVNPEPLVKALAGCGSSDPARIRALLYAATKLQATTNAIAADAVASSDVAVLKAELPAILLAIKSIQPQHRIAGFDPADGLTRAVAKTAPDTADVALPALKAIIVDAAIPNFSSRTAAIRILPKFGDKGIAVLASIPDGLNSHAPGYINTIRELQNEIAAAAADAGSAGAPLVPILAKWVSEYDLQSTPILLALASMGKDAAAALPEVRAVASRHEPGPATRPDRPDRQIAALAAIVVERLEGKLPPPLKAAPKIDFPREMGAFPAGPDRKRDIDMLRYLLTVSAKDSQNPAFYGVWGSHPDATRYGMASGWGVVGDPKKAIEIAPDLAYLGFTNAALSAAIDGDMQAGAILLRDAEMYALTLHDQHVGSSGAREAIARVALLTSDAERGAAMVNDPEASRRLFEMALRSGDLPTAEKIVMTIGTGTGDNFRQAGSMLDLSAAYEKAGNSAAAQKWIESALTAGLHGETAARVIGKLFVMGKTEAANKALASIEDGQFQRPGEAKQRLVASLLPRLLSAGHVDAAVALAGPVPSVKPGQEAAIAVARAELALQVWLAGRKPQAEKLLQEAVTLYKSFKPDPASAVLHSSLTEVDRSQFSMVAICAVMNRESDAKGILQDLMAKVPVASPAGGSSKSGVGDSTFMIMANNFLWLGDAASAQAAVDKVKDQYQREEGNRRLKAGPLGLSSKELRAEAEKLHQAGLGRFAPQLVAQRQAFQPFELQMMQRSSQPETDASDPVGSLKNLHAGGGRPMLNDQGRPMVLGFIASAGRSDRWKEAVDIDYPSGLKRYYLRRLATSRAAAGDIANALGLLQKASSLVIDDESPEEKAVEPIEAAVAEARVKVAGGDRGGAIAVMRKTFTAGKPLPLARNDYTQSFANHRVIARTWALTGDSASAWAYHQSLPEPDPRFVAGIVDMLIYRLSGDVRHSEDRTVLDDWVR